MATSYNSSATIYVQNTTSKSAQIWFSHQYSSDTVQKWPASGSAPFIPPNGKAGPLKVGFNTGTFYTGQDYWFCAIQPRHAPQPLSTEGSWEDPEKRCTLTHADDSQTETFQVNTSVFRMLERGGPHAGCSTAVGAANGAALIAASQAKKTKAA